MKMMVGSTWNAKMEPEGSDDFAEGAGVGQPEFAEQNLRAREGR